MTRESWWLLAAIGSVNGAGMIATYMFGVMRGRQVERDKRSDLERALKVLKGGGPRVMRP